METQETTPNTAAPKDVYAIINEKILEQLNNGTVPWQKPWHSGGLPQNLITKKHYHGINVMLLAMVGYEHNQFITFNQLQDVGGKVKKGEKGHLVVYWKVDTPSTEEEHVVPAEEKRKAILRYYYVFNISQCENIPSKYLPTVREAQDVPTCEVIVKAMPLCPKIQHKEQSAYYNPKEDFVNMPKKRSFKTDVSYYATLFHELIHSTGHESRLDRKTLSQMAAFGSEDYSQEELVAEMGTCYLQSFAGITPEIKQSAAYIQCWLKKLQNDRLFIFQASSAAQKAVDFILNVHSDIEEQKAE